MGKQRVCDERHLLGESEARLSITDAKQSIGKPYARMDEVGTPFCFTIDGQSKEDGTVTVRNRDDASQVRIDGSRCLEYLGDNL